MASISFANLQERLRFPNKSFVLCLLIYLLTLLNLSARTEWQISTSNSIGSSAYQNLRKIFCTSHLYGFAFMRLLETGVIYDTDWTVLPDVFVFCAQFGWIFILLLLTIRISPSMSDSRLDNKLYFWVLYQPLLIFFHSKCTGHT